MVVFVLKTIIFDEDIIMNLKQIGVFIKQKRKEKGLTQEQLAEKLDIGLKAFLNGNVVNVCRLVH